MRLSHNIEKAIRLRDQNEKRLYDLIVMYLSDNALVPKHAELSKKLDLHEGRITEFMSRMVQRGLISKSRHNASLRVLKPYTPYTTERKQLPLFDSVDVVLSPVQSVPTTQSSTDIVIDSLHKKRAELVAQRASIDATVLIIDEAVTRLLELSDTSEPDE